MTFENSIQDQPMKDESTERSVEILRQIAKDSLVSTQYVGNKKEQKQSKILAAQEKHEKYYKQFDFFFNRSCFRIMTEFYKEKFNKFYNAQMLILKKEHADLWRK